MCACVLVCGRSCDSAGSLVGDLTGRVTRVTGSSVDGDRSQISFLAPPPLFILLPSSYSIIYEDVHTYSNTHRYPSLSPSSPLLVLFLPDMICLALFHWWGRLALKVGGCLCVFSMFVQCSAAERDLQHLQILVCAMFSVLQCHTWARPEIRPNKLFVLISFIVLSQSLRNSRLYPADWFWSAFPW